MKTRFLLSLVFALNVFIPFSAISVNGNGQHAQQQRKYPGLGVVLRLHRGDVDKLNLLSKGIGKKCVDKSKENNGKDIYWFQRTRPESHHVSLGIIYNTPTKKFYDNTDVQSLKDLIEANKAQIKTKDFSLYNVFLFAKTSDGQYKRYFEGQGGNGAEDIKALVDQNKDIDMAHLVVAAGTGGAFPSEWNNVQPQIEKQFPGLHKTATFIPHITLGTFTKYDANTHKIDTAQNDHGIVGPGNKGKVTRSSFSGPEDLTFLTDLYKTARQNFINAGFDKSAPQLALDTLKITTQKPAKNDGYRASEYETLAEVSMN